MSGIRVALASLSGQADASWAMDAAEYVDAAFLGGIALDDRTRSAAREMVARDRNEFLPDDPIAFIDDQLTVLTDIDLVAGFNVRTTTLGPLREAAAVCRERDAILEINAHCRQAEMCAIGCGESLLKDTERVCEYVETAADAGARVSVKLRTEVPGVDVAAVAEAAADAGASFVHVDAMDSEPVIADVARATEATVIANNGVRDAASVREYLDFGADAVSVGRPSDDPSVLKGVQAATAAWYEDADAGPRKEQTNP